MKQKDIAILIIIIVFAAVASFVVSTKFVAPPDRNKTAEVVSSIDSTFNIPSSEFFSTEAINPTVRIQIAPNENNQPFDSGQ